MILSNYDIIILCIIAACVPLLIVQLYLNDWSIEKVIYKDEE